MAKRKKNSNVGKQRRKAILARAAKRKRRKAKSLATHGATVPSAVEPKAEHTSPKLPPDKADAAEPTPVSSNRERRTPRRKASPLGTIKHEYTRSFVSKRESPRTDRTAAPLSREGAYGSTDFRSEAALIYADYCGDGERTVFDNPYLTSGLPMIDPDIGACIIEDPNMGSDVEAAIARQIEFDRKITEGNDALRFTRLSDARDRYADINSLPDFTSVIKKSDIRDEARRIIKNDTDATLLRFEYKSSLLKKELSLSSRLLVNRAYGTDGRDAGRVKRRARRLGRKARYALKYEKQDNSRYYGALLDAYGKLTSDSVHDKSRMNALVTELYELIARRDAVNRRLIALYSGGAKRGIGVGKREAVRLAAVQREQRRYEKLYNDVLEARIELGARDRLLSDIDKQTARAGEIAECKYALSHTALGRSERRSLKRFLRARREDYKRMRVEIGHKAGVLIRKAKNRRWANIAAIFGWVAFGIILLLVGIVWWNWDAIWAFLSQRASELMI